MINVWFWGFLQLDCFFPKFHRHVTEQCLLDLVIIRSVDSLIPLVALGDADCQLESEVDTHFADE